MDHGESSADFVQSLARGLAVIRAFDGENRSLTSSDVARRAGIPRAAAGRFLRTLEHLGYIRASEREYSLTPRVLELGFSYLSALSLPEIVQPHLEQLSHQIEESVSAAVLDGADIVYVARAATRRIMSVRINIGTRFPAYATSMGRVLLAGLADAERRSLLDDTVLSPLTDRTVTGRDALRDELERVGRQGWSLVDGELEIGLRSLAVPIHRADGSVAAAVNISTAVGSRSADELVKTHLSALTATARAIDAELRLV